MPCSEARNEPPAVTDPEQLALVLWDAMQNSIVGNEVSESGVADLGFGSLQTDLASLGNCFDGNTFTTTAPTDLEGLAPCEGEPTATDWAANALDLVALMGAEKPQIGRAHVWTPVTTPHLVCFLL